MPELPEVETTRAGIEKYISKQKIEKIILHTNKLRWPIPKAVLQLQTQSINHVARRGKYILLETNTGTGILHLGMSGYLQLLPINTPKKKHDHVEIIFENNLCLRLNDARRFGAFLFQANNTTHSLLKNLGPEPLTPNFSASYLLGKLAGSSRAIKLIVMDSAIVVGVGNIYANEALFNAKINPNRPGDSISLTECKNLVKAIKIVLQKAIKAGGTTLKDFQNIVGKPGYFQQKLKVYGREAEPCFICGTNLQSNRLGQRSTVWCGHCQN